MCYDSALGDRSGSAASRTTRLNESESPVHSLLLFHVDPVDPPAYSCPLDHVLSV